jgi:hypothetical protein
MKLLIIWFILDKDECTTKDPCDENANCNNTDGSFVCRCHSGFSGDGLICTGAYYFIRLTNLDIYPCLIVAPHHFVIAKA